MKISSEMSEFLIWDKVCFSTISSLASGLETISSFSSQEKLPDAPFKYMDVYLTNLFNQ